MTKSEKVLIPLLDEDFPAGFGQFSSQELAALVCGAIDEEGADMADGRQVFHEAFYAGLRPDPLLTVSEWADAHRRLPQRAAAEAGQWHTSRTPYLREIMDRLSPGDPTEIIVLMKGAQIGGTEAGNNWLGFIMDHAPGPAMMVQPTVEMAKRVSKQRIATMIEGCPRLREKVRDPRSRDSGNTILAKEFPGGILFMTGANSAVGLRSAPVRYLFLDEVDGYEADIDGEGNPVDLAIKRTATFRRNRKVFICSTPTIKDLSNIERAYNASDQRRYHVPCPYCGALQPILWENLRKVSEHPMAVDWPAQGPDEMGLLCAHCERMIPEHRKSEMLEHGRWIPTSTGQPGVAGYHLSALYSPVGWYSWTEALRDLRAAKEQGVEKQKTWVNTVLGEVWEESGETLDPTGLLARREHYNAEVPERVLVLTAGVDTQDDRLEVEVVGWRTGEESWGIDYRVLWGDPDGQAVWDQLDDLLASPWVREDGAQLRIVCCCIDSAGHRTEAVYRYVQGRQHQGIFATIGRAGAGRPIISAPSPKRQGHSKRPIKLFTIGTDEAKSLLLARLRGREPGAGYCHFPLREPYDERYFLQLTAEKRVIRYKKGVPIYEWIQIRARNEALDCRIEAHAALCLLNPRWPSLERRAAPRSESTPSQQSPASSEALSAAAPEAAAESPEPEVVPQSRAADPARRRRRSFADRWRD